MAAAMGWSVDGKRVELRAAFPAGKLSIDGEETKLSASGVWPVKVGKRTLTFKRTRGFMGPKNELFMGTDLVPATPKHVPQTLAPDGSLCAVHKEAAAAITCARCGSFTCEACSGPDLTHCRPCLAKLAAEAAKKAAAMAYLTPVVVFGLLGGLLAALIGGLAGAAVVTIARRSDSKAVKLGAAIGLYGLAVVVYLVLVVVIQSQTR
ncbi:MAG: hypothetical protein ACYC8T_26085 [Myxococcaceae bacterium]